MTRNTFYAAAIAAGFCFGNVLAFAQQDQTQNRQGEGISAAAGNLDDKTTGPNLRASELIGMNIQNLQGENVGEVEDIVLNVESGKVNYAAVSYGGFLGIGDDLFAVPFEAFKVGKKRGEEEYVLVLDVTEEQLEGAQGFDKDSWPNFADQKFTSELDRRYKVERQPAVDRGTRTNRGGVDVRTDRDGVEVKVKRDRENNPNRDRESNPNRDRE